MRSLDKDTGLPRGLVILSKDAACCDVPTLFRWKNCGEFTEKVLRFAGRARGALREESAKVEDDGKRRKARQLAAVFARE